MALQLGARVAGLEPGQRRLNGPQTTGRHYRNLSTAEAGISRTDDVAVRMRDGVELLADVFVPDSGGRHPALVSFSSYPRQIQDLGAPLGFIEAGMSDFFVPRGYAHVIANARGTSGSGGTWTFLDQQERDDVFDVIEWAAAQPWCDGTVGMLGISYFGLAQLAAAAVAPPSLKAIFPLAANESPYDIVWHHGLQSSAFFSAWIAAVGVLAAKSNAFWRGQVLGLARHVFMRPTVHRRLEHFNGEAAMTTLQKVIRSAPADEPYMRLWQEAVVEHPVYDTWWSDRDVGRALANVTIPVYLGCDWDNSVMHLPGTFSTWRALAGNPNVRMSLLPSGALTWPWESMHYEVLAWYDQWLKGRDTGVLEGPAVRYYLPVADEWRTSSTWPPGDSSLHAFRLWADGRLAEEPGEAGSRSYLHLAETSGRPVHAHSPATPTRLEWRTDPLARPLDFAGDIELQLEATITASDTAWIVVLYDVAPDGSTEQITAGWLRASMRTVDEQRSTPGAPALDCSEPIAVPVGERVHYRIPIVANARRLLAGHRLSILLGSSDTADRSLRSLGFTHAPIGDSSLNTIHSTSHLLLPVLR
jgi:putative CocE/NonD family hydrolase